MVAGFPPLPSFVMVMFQERLFTRLCGLNPDRPGASRVFLVLQPLQWCCVDCVIHHERDVREEQHHTYMWREQAIKE